MKDERKVMNNTRQVISCKYFWRYLLGVVVFLQLIRGSQSGQLVDYVSSPYREWRNVTCVYHETKFTCDCGNVEETMFLPKLSGHVFHVSVSNCKSLSVPSNALAETKGLRSVTFKQVSNLELEEYSLAFPRFASHTPLILEFESVNVNKIHSHAIDGNIEEIAFLRGSIATIQAFGFSSLKDHAHLLKFDSVLIDMIEPQAFKKFIVEHLEISNCVFTSNLPSKSFYDIDVLQTMVIQNTTFGEVHSRSFSFKVISKLTMLDNKFDRVEGEWFDAGVRSSVLIRNNHFGNTSPIAFRALRVDKEYSSSERLEMRFINNTIHMGIDPLPMEFNSQFTLHLSQLQYDQNFPCEMLEKNRLPKVEFFRTFADYVYFQTRSSNQSLPVAKIIEHDCHERSYLVYILVGVLVLVLVVVAVATIIGYQIVKKRKKRKMDIVMPEPRTYKETQIVLQIENAGLLKTDL